MSAPNGETVQPSVITDVALLTINQGQLGVVVKEEADGNLSLPNTVSRGPSSSEDAASLVVKEVLEHAVEAPPLEPCIWQLGAENVDYTAHLVRVGYTAVAGVFELSPDNDFTIVEPDVLLTAGDAEPQLIPEDLVVLQAAVASLREATDIKALHALYKFYKSTGRRNTGPIVARLVSNPDKFTILEVRTIFEVISGNRHQRDTVRRYIHDVLPGLVKTEDETVGLSGRPARYYSMPAEYRILPRPIG